MSEFIMMVGIPCSGKSTYVRNEYSNWVVLSTDDYIEEKAKEVGKTYGDVFKLYIKEAEQNLNRQLRAAIENNENIVWDQTNGTVKSRAKKLKSIPSQYHKTAIVVGVDLDVALRRNEERSCKTGKFIPESVIKSMHSGQQPPTKEEGFDLVVTI